MAYEGQYDGLDEAGTRSLTFVQKADERGLARV
jgi:hypothetical protein